MSDDVLSSTVKANYSTHNIGDTLYQIGPKQNTSNWFGVFDVLTGGIAIWISK
jgi:hypothetical protein